MIAKTILVAEDDSLLRLIATAVLEDAGYSVLQAEHAAAALMLLGDHAAEIDALFTDIHMPGDMNGLALAHHVHAHFPGLAVLVVSGQATPSGPDLPEGSRFLPKPYDADHVVASLGELLDHRRHTVPDGPHA